VRTPITNRILAEMLRTHDKPPSHSGIPGQVSEMEPFTVSPVGTVSLDLGRYVHPVERRVDDLLVGVHQIVNVDHAVDSLLSIQIEDFQH
jgi:hypothetical protein